MKYFVAILESSTYGTWKDTSFSVSSISDAFIQKVTSDDYLLVSFLITSVLEWRARAAGPILPARWVPYSLSETVGLVAALAASRDLSKLHFSTGGVKSNFSPGPLTSFSHRRLQFSSHSSLYTNLSGRRGETHISLCLNHRVSLGKINQGNDSTSPPALWETRQHRQGWGMWTKGEQMQDHPLLAPQVVPTYWAWSRWRIFWQHGFVSTWTFNFEN